MADLRSVRRRGVGLGPAMRVLYRFFDVASAEAALAGGVIFGLAVALGLWYLGWRELRG